MDAGRRKKSILVVSVIGMIMAIIALLLRKSEKASRYGKIGWDGFKDFLEVHELGLRPDCPRTGPQPIYDGVRVVWDHDGSEWYDVYWGEEYIYKSEVLADTDTLQKHRVQISERVDPDVQCGYVIDLKKFQCRVKSSRGRISRILRYPERRVTQQNVSRLVATFTTFGDRTNVSLQPSHDKDDPILEYRVQMYLGGGKALRQTVPGNNVNPVMVSFDGIVQAMCYVTRIYRRGRRDETFIGWVGPETIFGDPLDI